MYFEIFYLVYKTSCKVLLLICTPRVESKPGVVESKMIWLTAECITAGHSLRNYHRLFLYCNHSVQAMSMTIPRILASKAIIMTVPEEVGNPLHFSISTKSILSPVCNSHAYLTYGVLLLWEFRHLGKRSTSVSIYLWYIEVHAACQAMPQYVYGQIGW